MGACCSKDIEAFRGFVDDDVDEAEEVDETRTGDYGARVRLQGSSMVTSMFTQQGRKGVNQDAMTVWEDFTGDKDVIFCGVFDGHGPSGHKVARQVCDVLPSKISSEFKISQINSSHSDIDVDDGDEDKDSSYDTVESHDNDNGKDGSLSSWKTSFINSFKKMDEELSRDSSIDSWCSGTTAVNILKQGDDLIIANLGDSRAILGTQSNKNQLVPVQLTVDMKPNLPSEAERIKNCKGRVFSVDEEPEVFRVWMPEEDYPGLAMARAFGDFCLKDYGLISIPEVSHRKLKDKDEFVVLATDGVWDVLTNKEVIRIVASAKKRSMAAKVLVNHAVRAWRYRYPRSKVDDCAAICLFLKQPPSLSNSKSAVIRDNANDSELAVSSNKTTVSEGGVESVNGKIAKDSKEEWSALEGECRVNSLLKVPRFARVLSWRKTEKDIEDVVTQS